MMVYVVFYKDYKYRRGELMGLLVERRKETRGETLWGTGTKWARQVFGHLVKDKKDIFIFPKKMDVNTDDETMLVEKGILTKEEYLELQNKIGRGTTREVNKKG